MKFGINIITLGLELNMNVYSYLLIERYTGGTY